MQQELAGVEDDGRARREAPRGGHGVSRGRRLVGDAGTAAACVGARGRGLRARMVGLQEVLEAGDPGARIPLELEGEGAADLVGRIGRDPDEDVAGCLRVEFGRRRVVGPVGNLREDLDRGRNRGGRSQEEWRRVAARRIPRN